jgi:predicted GH43/DUF377 family glycosyl hydrolase
VTVDGLARRRPGRLRPDPARVITRLFVPGHELANGSEGRATGTAARILALSDDEVAHELESVRGRFTGRHRDLEQTFAHHAERIANRLDAPSDLSADRWLLLGATFTHEYSVEGAALCNPSAIAHPDQTGVPTGSMRFVLSVRQIGEGHRSSIGFRTGLIDGDGDIIVDAPGPFTTPGTIASALLDGRAFRDLAHGMSDGAEAISWVLDHLGERFTSHELDVRLAELVDQRDTRRDTAQTAQLLREAAANTYVSTFEAATTLSERVLYPATGAESNGVEDARFVRFVDDDGMIVYHATYTAFDGISISQQLLTTSDLTSFASAPLRGAAAANKGLALFPRRIRGRYAALSRRDGTTNSIAFSDDIHHWPTAAPLAPPTGPWEAIQTGNCGSPIETDEGWLVLTHGVGPMRTYSIGACLLDLDDPSVVIGRLDRPLLTPQPDERDGYVPNVVYSCGALAHGTTLLVPYGIGDAEIGLATVALPELLNAIRSGERVPT